MLQFYFLSIFFNALSGYILAFGTDTGESPMETGFSLNLKNETLRLVLGVFTMLTGLLKLLSVVGGDIPVIGDLFPALVGLGVGFVQVFYYYRSRSSLESEKTKNLEEFFVKNNRWIGFISLTAAALHFLFPTVLFL
jgi:hypothetical protein